MSEDAHPLDRIAESYARLAETQQLLAQTQIRSEGTQRLFLRLQGFSLVLIGLSLGFTGYLVWQHMTQWVEHAAHTQALIDILKRLPAPPLP
jgi:hypothetical protein